VVSLTEYDGTHQLGWGNSDILLPQLWFSSHLKPGHVMLLDTVVKTVVADVVAQTQDKSNVVLPSKQLRHGTCTVRIVLLRD
jgi:hypothetical protein